MVINLLSVLPFLPQLNARLKILHNSLNREARLTLYFFMIYKKVKEQYKYIFVDKYLQIMIYEIVLIGEFNKLLNNQKDGFFQYSY